MTLLNLRCDQVWLDLVRDAEENFDRVVRLVAQIAFLFFVFLVLALLVHPVGFAFAAFYLLLLIRLWLVLVSNEALIHRIQEDIEYVQRHGDN